MQGTKEEEGAPSPTTIPTNLNILDSLYSKEMFRTVSLNECVEKASIMMENNNTMPPSPSPSTTSCSPTFPSSPLPTEPRAQEDNDSGEPRLSSHPLPPTSPSYLSPPSLPYSLNNFSPFLLQLKSYFTLFCQTT